jgi:hypothetical protein
MPQTSDILKGHYHEIFRPWLVSKVDDDRKLTHGLRALWSPG